MELGSNAALVTPSYYRDFERCKLLAHSFLRYVSENIIHYIVVDSQDFPLFKQLEGKRTKIVTQESLVQATFFRLPFIRNWRFSLATLPVRGWIWQQIVKLSLANLAQVDTIFIVDSDTFFAREVDLLSYVKQGKVPLFRQQGEFYQTDKNTQSWHKAAREIFAIEPLTQPANVGYISPLIYWRRDVLEKIYDYFSARFGSKFGWINAVGRSVTFSEYVFYGVFVESILGTENSGHYFTDTEPCQVHWSEQELGLPELEKLAASRLDDQFLVMINAKSHTPVSLIRQAYGFV